MVSKAARKLATARARMRRAPPVPGQIAEALHNAAQARLFLAGKVTFGGFWTATGGRRLAAECWRDNAARARRLRLTGR